MFTLHMSQHNRNIQRTNVQFLAGAATLRFNFSTLDVTCTVVYTKSTPLYFALTCNKSVMRTCSYFSYYSSYSIQCRVNWRIQEHGLGTQQAMLKKARRSGWQVMT